MTELDFETDTFLALLTDALRSGPGSPTWHEAVRLLRVGGIENADEYQLLVTAREHLESGKDYRSIRAGPGFTQRLMSRLEEDTANLIPKSPMATAIAVASAGLMLLVLGSIGYVLWTAAGHGAVDDSALLTRTVMTWNKVLPDQWKTIGARSVVSDRGGMMIGPGGEETPTGGGAYWTQPIDPNDPFAIVAILRAYHFEDDVTTEIFVTDQPEFADVNGTTPHEFVWLLKSNQAQVVSPDRRIETQSSVVSGTNDIIPLRIIVDHAQASVDISEKRIWSGPISLDPVKPRFIGIRFLKQGTKDSNGVVILTMRVDMRPK